MTPMQQRSWRARPFGAEGAPAPGPAAGPVGAMGRVTVSPSRPQVRRSEPSVSFQVSAPGARSFDVVVATDPALFDPAEAHRRTPKNFRSSRQDFQGTPIEIETGFYLLPRAFLRDLISVEPRPSRLFYLAVAYPDAEGRGPGICSTPPEALASAPSIVIAQDLAAANLSKVLGMAVDRLGAVDGAGRVAPAQSHPAELPDAIGGLPIHHRRGAHLADPYGGAGGDGRGWPDPHVQPAPAQPGMVNGATPPAWPPAPPSGEAPRPGPDAARRGEPPAAAPRPAPDPSPQATPRAAPPAEEPPVGSGGFVDDDYAYGGGEPADDGFRDLDSPRGGAGAAAFSYDDGYDDGYGGHMGGAAGGAPGRAGDRDAWRAPSRSYAEEPAAPIPPLDPAPDPALGPAAAPAPAARPAPPQTDGRRNQAPQARPAPAPSAPGDPAADDALLQAVIGEGAGGRYEALSLDGGFRGRFGTTNPYYQRAHDGLRLGPHQAMQDGGELGELLALMQSADPAAFAAVFAPDAEALLAATTAEGPSALDAPDGRGARVQPVGGRDLWEEPWVERFRAAARHPAFQAAMRAQILARRLAPLEPAADALGIATPRGRAMLVALAIQLGAEGALAHLRAAAHPFDTPARLGAALDALGFSDLSAFRVAKGLPAGDQMDAATHFALFAALRRLGPESPVQVPDGEGVMDLLVTAAGPGPVGDALLRLRVSHAFGEPGQAEG